MLPFDFHPNQVFDNTKHTVDLVAVEYVGKATNDIHHLVPVAVSGDGNCLYHSIILLTNEQSLTVDELRGKLISISHMLEYILVLNNFSSNDYRAGYKRDLLFNEVCAIFWTG